MDQLIRVSTLYGFAEQVTELGGVPEHIFDQLNVDPKLLQDPDNFISYKVFLKLLGLAAHETNCDVFGLKLSRKQDLSILGTLGLAMQESRNVREALNELVDFFYTITLGASVSLEVFGNLAILCYTIHESPHGSSRQQGDLAAGLGMNILKLLCGEKWRPKCAYFIHSSPKDIRLHNQIFQCPIFFEQEHSSFTFDATVLDTQLDQAREDLHLLLLNHLTSSPAFSKLDISAQIKQLITKAMFSGDCSIDKVAGYMSTSKRTLQRRLKVQNISYQNILEDVRLQTAKNYLKESKTSLTQIADILCYSDLSTFSRVFKKRTQYSPTQWRKLYQQ